MEDRKMSQSEQIQHISGLLDAQNAKNQEKITEEVSTKQTVADDFKASDEIEVKIKSQEEIIRQVLTLFNISYDDLIRLDGKSAYCKAVNFYPHLIDEVKKAECPPLKALQIAAAMKPYLEFTSKYGSSLDEIKAKLKDEVKQEIQTKPSKPEEKVAEQSALFSDLENAVMQNKKDKNLIKEDSLSALFDR